MASIEQEIAGNETLFSELEKAKQALEGVLSEMNAGIDSKREIFTEKEQLSKELKKSEEELRRVLDSIQLKLSELQMKKQNIQDQIWEKHRVDISSEEGFEMVEEEDGEIRQRLERIYKTLEKIGEVNPTAIEEFESLQQRHLFYQEQYDDLKSSLDSLGT